MATKTPRTVARPTLVHVETTLDNEGAVHRLVGVVLAQRLAACANVATLRSRYWWEGRIEDASEFLVVFKTTAERQDELIAAIEEHHPYEVPYIASQTLSNVPQAYGEWLHGETTRAR